jgi:hypothetical protein
MRSERIDERDIGGVSPPGDHNPADPGDVVARIKCMPLALEKHFHPSAEIHWINHRHPDIAEVAIHVPCRNVETTAERHSQMGKVSANPDSLMEDFES